MVEIAREKWRYLGCFDMTLTYMAPLCFTIPVDFHNAAFHYTLAIETARSELAITEDDPLKHQLALLYSNRAAASTMMRHYHEALSDCDSAISSDKTYDKAYLRKAQLQVMNGLLKEAVETCDQVLQMDPNNTKAMEDRRDIQGILRKYQQAHEFVQRLYTQATTTSRCAIVNTMADIEAILAKCVAWDDIKVLQAEALWALGRSDEAFELCNKLVKHVVDNAQLHNLGAAILISRGKSEEAIIHLRTVLAHDPDNQRAVALFAQLREFLDAKAVADRAYKTRHYDDALEQYDLAMKLCPEQSPAYMAKLYFNRACTNASLGRHDLSINDCTESIRLNGEYIKAYMRRAASHRRMNTDQQRRGELAISDYQVALTLCKTKAQRKEIVRKIRETKKELRELRRSDLVTMMKIQQRQSVTTMVTPDCSPEQWLRKAEKPDLVRTRTEDSEVSLSQSFNNRSRTSSASSWRSTNSSGPLYSAMDVM